MMSSYVQFVVRAQGAESDSPAAGLGVWGAEGGAGQQGEQVVEDGEADAGQGEELQCEQC